MGESISVTLIVVNYNSGTLLDACLSSVFKQSLLPDKVVVLDNSSEDSSYECAVKYSDIQLIRFSENTGFAAANNYSIQRCDTDYVALLNPDTTVDRNWLKCLMNAANDNPNVAMFGSRQVCYECPTVIDGLGDAYHVSGVVWRSRHGKIQSEKDLSESEIFSPCAAAALYRRDAFLDVGGFDEDFFCYVEDVDLGFRLRLRGFTAMYIPNAVVHHVGSALTGGKHSDFAIYFGHRNLVWAFLKNMPGCLFWIFLPLHILMNLFSLVVFAAKGKGRIVFRSKIDAIKGSPKMLRKRRVIQSKWSTSTCEIFRVLNKSVWPL